MSTIPERPAGQERLGISPEFLALIVLNLLATATFAGAEARTQAFLAGVFAGQLATLSTWGALGPGNLFVRWAVCLLGVVALFSLVLAMEEATASNFFSTISNLPLVFLAIQLPVWGMRLVTGCRLVRVRPGDSLPPRTRQFRVQDLLITTTIVAVTLGSVRLGLALTEHPRPGFELRQVGEMAVFCGAVAVLSGFVVLPSIYASLVRRSRAYGAIGLSVYIVMFTVLLFGALVALFGRPPGAGEMAAVLFSVNGEVAAVVFVTLSFARSHGYVLLWPGRNQSPDEPAEPEPAEEAGESPFQTGE